MLRFIGSEVNVGAAANVGGPVSVEHKTFTDAAKLEEWLRYEVNAPDLADRRWITRSVIGVELVEREEE